MSSNGFAQPLRIERRRSRTLERGLVAIHAAAILAIFAADIPVALQLLLALVAAADLYRAVRRHARLTHPRAVLRAVQREGDAWHIVLVDGTRLPARVLGNSYVAQWMVVLNFRAGRRRYSLLLPADGVDADVLRRTRVWLRYAPRPPRGQAGGPSSQPTRSIAESR